jgi:hypothetical protein
MDEIKPFFKKLPQIVTVSNQPIKQDYLKQANLSGGLPGRGAGEWIR